MSKKSQPDPDFEGFEDKQEEEMQEEEIPALEHVPYEELEAQLNAMEAKANDSWDKLVRTKAEMDNLLRLSDRKVEAAHKYALAKFVEELLPVMDGLEQGLSLADAKHESVASLRAGMEMTAKMLIGVLAKFGVKQIDPMGETFNPVYHEAMTMQAQPGAAPNTVIAVLQKGYELNDRLIRPARVIVAK